MAYTMNVVMPNGRVEAYVHKDIRSDDVDDRAYIEVMNRIGPYTMSVGQGAGATYNLFQSVKYVSQNGIPGSIVECGVWRGGGMMLIAYALQHFSDAGRNLYLYDTFSGMTEPDQVDVDWDGQNLRELWGVAAEKGKRMGYGGDVESVQANLLQTKYDSCRMHFVKGDVLETIPAVLPQSIALLRLDTDFYKSTYHELMHLYPQVVRGGLVYIDDYGWCSGAREATNKFLMELDVKPLQVRIDESVRLLVKP